MISIRLKAVDLVDYLHKKSKIEQLRQVARAEDLPKIQRAPSSWGAGAYEHLHSPHSASNMSAQDIFDAFFEQVNTYGRLSGLGLRIRHDGYPTSVLAKLWLILLAILVLSFGYTMLVADSDSKWRSCAVSPMILQGIVKYVVHIRYARVEAEIFAFLRRIYELNWDRNTRNYWLLIKWAQRIWLVVKYAWIPFAITFSVFIAMPVYQLIRNGKREMMLEIWLIGVDHSTLAGYLMNVVFHLSTMALALVGTLSSDLTLFLCIMHLWPMADIWRHMWRQMDRALVNPLLCVSPARKDYWMAMLNVHRDFHVYLRDVSQIFEHITFCEVFTCGAMLCTLLYCYIMLAWFQAMFFAGLILVKLLMYCLLGTLAEMAADQVYRTLVDNNWYLLPCDEKRILLVVLATAQKPRLLKAFTMPLNMVTCMEVLKTVYTVGMLLVKSVE